MLSWSVAMPSLRCEVRSTTRTNGDFRVSGDQSLLGGIRRGIVDAPWTWLQQTHGVTVLPVDAPGALAGHEADGAFTSTVGAPIAVTTADCSPVVLVGTTAVAVVHAGWRGAIGGIIDVAAKELVATGSEPVAALLGPSIGPGNYAFSPEDLEPITAAFGSSVVASTTRGEPALDMPALIIELCSRAGWPPPDRPPCTSEPEFFSHRVRQDVGRQTTVAWLDDGSFAGHTSSDGSSRRVGS